MNWTAPLVPERRTSPVAGSEKAVLEGWLDYHRDTLATKCAGLTADQLTRPSIEPSSLTLLGIVRHLTEIEQWFRSLFTGESPEELYSTATHEDGAFDQLSTTNAEADLARWRAETAFTRAAMPRRGLDETFEDEGIEQNLRSVFIHVIEEYARHNGHADLLRERIDGVTGV